MTDRPDPSGAQWCWCSASVKHEKHYRTALCVSPRCTCESGWCFYHNAFRPPATTVEPEPEGIILRDGEDPTPGLPQEERLPLSVTHPREYASRIARAMLPQGEPEPQSEEAPVSTKEGERG